MDLRPRCLIGLLCLLPGVLAAAEPTGPVPALSLVVDPIRHEITVTIGPFDVPAMPSGVDGHAAHEHVMPRYSEEFIWPVNGFGRGFTLQLTDSAGHAVTRRALHHIVIENKGRRQLMMPVSERLLAAGRETGNLMLPSSIGLPLAIGSPMKAVTMWHNETGADLKGVTLRLVIRYMPPSQMPRPLPVLPFTFDVEDKLGLPNTFDIPPGPSERSRDFVMPVDGRVLGVSGHMHDYAVALRLEDVATGKVIIRLPVRTDSVGKILNVPIKYYGIMGDGLRLYGGKRYRLVAVYNNPTATTQSGAMAHLDGLLSPTKISAWPAVGSPEMAYQDAPDTVKATAEAHHHH